MGLRLNLLRGPGTQTLVLLLLVTSEIEPLILM